MDRVKWMVYLYFKEEVDLFYFCERLFRRQSVIDVKWEKTLQHYYKLRLDSSSLPETALPTCLTDVYIHHYLHLVYVDIIRHVYMVEADATVEHILQLVEQVSGDDYFLQKIFPKHRSVRQTIYQLIRQYVEGEEKVYFDAMIRFHFWAFEEKCVRLVGYAVDEWKREEEHQLYIEHLRTFVKHRPTKRRRIHVLTDGGGAMFYEEDGTRLSRVDLERLMEQYPLYVVGLDEREHIISPIITLAPEQILLYAEDTVEGPIQTIMDVFQERVSHLPMNMFPFASE